VSLKRPLSAIRRASIWSAPQIRSPVDGWISNLLAQLGDYASVGKTMISIVNADTFWVDAYFEETQLASVREGDPVEIKLMGHTRSFAVRSTALRGPSTSRMRTPISKGSRMSTPYSLGSASLSACRSAFGSIRFPMAFGWSPA
jgi:hypothetical protein